MDICSFGMGIFVGLVSLVALVLERFRNLMGAMVVVVVVVSGAVEVV